MPYQNWRYFLLNAERLLFSKRMYQAKYSCITWYQNFIWKKSRDVSTNWINAHFRFLLHLKRQKMKLLKEKKTSLTVWSPWPQVTSMTLKTIHQWDKSLILWNIWFKKTKTFTKKFYPSYKITLSERKVKSDEDLWSLRNL